MASPRFSISAAEPLILEEVARNARQADIAELWAASHLTPAQVLQKALQLSPQTYIGWHDETPICAFGIMPISTVTGWGAPWMVGTHHLDSCALGFLKKSKETIGHMLSSWAHLTNYVDARNTKAILWLKWLGFEFHPAAPHGQDGLAFHRFDMRSSDV